MFGRKKHFEDRLKKLGFKTKGFPDHVRRDGLSIIERAMKGATATDLGGHRLFKDRNAVVVHVHRDYVVIFRDAGDRLHPTHFVSHEAYNKMYR